MPVNNFNVGRDIRLTFTDVNNAPITFNRIKMFTSRQKTFNRESTALDGVTRHINIPGGWEGSFEIEKLDSSVDTFFSQLESAYYSGQGIGTITITETIQNPNGSLQTYQYIGVVLTFENAGDFNPDNYITQKVSFSAEKREPIV